MQRIDVIENGVLWLADQPASDDRVWRRVRNHAAGGATLTIRPHRSPTPAPPPPPGPTPLETSSRSILFFATVTDDACRWAAGLSRKWRFALSADPRYPCSAFQLGLLRPAGSDRRIDVWGNQEQIGPQRIMEYGAVISADRCVFQSETADEYTSWPQGRSSVGNPNAWTSVQREAASISILAGRQALIAEVYNGRPDTYSSQGVPVASLCLGVSMDGGLRYPLADLLERTPAGARSTVSLWHAHGIYSNPEDRAAVATI